MSLPPILNRALKAAYDGANEIIHFSKRIDNVKVINKGINDITTNIEPVSYTHLTLPTNREV